VLIVEETRVSYWRRLVQARIDVISSGATPGGDSVRRLRAVLADASHGSRRTALLAVLPDQDMPPLPNLADLWAREPGADPHTNARLSADLVGAERALSAYRTTLHHQLAAATDELIARYREDPCRSFAALPAQTAVHTRAQAV
jgi:hypothetical protein